MTAPEEAGGGAAVPAVRVWLTALQDRMTRAFEAADGAARFVEDSWERSGGGGGRSRVLSDGAVFERAGINFSHVAGPRLPPSASASRPQLAGRGFEALGLSVVCHPANPYVPTAHCNVRYFESREAGDATVWWFGGGFDLTPYYPFEDDVVRWHRAAAAACEGFGTGTYRRFKSWCDRYFHLPHRDEPRGVGGLFFDDLDEWGFERCDAFARGVGSMFLEAYLDIVARRRSHPFGEREREFQLYRRGRYVEFNLVYDRGTLFGLQSGGRTESILMSLPPVVAWRYDWRPEPGSPEERLYRDFLRPREWL